MEMNIVMDKQKIMELTREFLIAIGENPDRKGLIDTPKRVAKMCGELLNPDNAYLRYTTFDSEEYSGIVLVKNIDFSSICEHHLLPFFGKIHVAYIPDKKIIGISKFARIVDKHAKKLQLQEKLAQEIINDINGKICPRGVAIYIEANHLCMNIRGINRRNSTTVTTLFSGEFEQPENQKIFLNITKQ